MLRSLRLLPVAILLADFVLAPGGIAGQARWSVTPELWIGSVDDEAQLLTRIGAVLVDRAGTVYIAQPQDQQIRVHGSDGRLVRTIGRKGGGPGEFEGLAGLHWLGDTLVAADTRSGRLTLFSRDGTLIETLTIAVRVEEPWARATASTLLRDGTALVSPGVPSSLVADGTVRFIPMWRVRRDGTVLNTVFEHDAGTSQLAISVGSGELFTQQPFSDATMVSLHADGVVLVERPVATSPREGTFTVRWLGFRGDTLRSRSYRYTPQPIRTGAGDSIVADHAKRFRDFASRAGVGQRELESALRRALVVPRYHVPVRDVRVAANGEIWLNRGPAQGGGRRYNVLSPQGDVLAVFDLPDRIRIVALNGDHLYSAETDDLDVPYLVRYRINRER